MTAEDTEMLQEKILQLCHAAGRFGLPDERLLRTLNKSGYALDAAGLDRNLRYLKSKGWIVEVEKQLRPDLRRWETTALGDDFLAVQGLI